MECPDCEIKWESYKKKIKPQNPLAKKKSNKTMFNFIVIFSQFFFRTHCSVPFLFAVRVSTCIVRMTSCRKKEYVLLQE